MTAPTVDYSQRAGNRPMPQDWQAPVRPVEHSRDEWGLYMADIAELPFAVVVHQFFADISEYQDLVSSRYPYPIVAIRADTGHREDYNLPGNKLYIDKHPDHIKVAPIYVVFIPGEGNAILRRLKNRFGSQCPPPYCPMVDMESGGGFAGPGNHSSEANDLVAKLADWCDQGGTDAGQARQLGYANGGDWSNNWAHRLPWMKRTLASYGGEVGVPDGYYARQYYGALPYGVPAGYPTSCAPFGSYVDMNVITRTASTIVDDFRLDWLSMASLADVEKAVLSALRSDAGKSAISDAVMDSTVPLSGDANPAPLGHVLDVWHPHVLGIAPVKSASAIAPTNPGD